MAFAYPDMPVEDLVIPPEEPSISTIYDPSNLVFPSVPTGEPGGSTNPLNPYWDETLSSRSAMMSPTLSEATTVPFEETRYPYNTQPLSYHVTAEQQSANALGYRYNEMFGRPSAVEISRRKPRSKENVGVRRKAIVSEQPRSVFGQAGNDRRKEPYFHPATPIEVPASNDGREVGCSRSCFGMYVECEPWLVESCKESPAVCAKCLMLPCVMGYKCCIQCYNCTYNKPFPSS
jgi:hypothetical protein